VGSIVILIGGPGTYVSCDPAHDKNWVNYSRPVELVAKHDLYGKAGDTVHWVVFEPAYDVRWLDDSDVTWTERLDSITGDTSLHKTRKRHAADTGGMSYLRLIMDKARKLGVTYHGIRKPGDFWNYIATFPPNSISSVWYSGHASSAGLFLQLTHTNNCKPAVTADGLLPTASISLHAGLKDRFVKGTKRASKFYGCYTSGFAKLWHDTFDVPAEGAGSKITFDGVFNEPKGVLKRLETTPTSSGNPNWTAY
jgi:hypothetical protein